MTSRLVLGLPVPAGADAVDALLPALRDALRGTGPAVHPHPANRAAEPRAGAGQALGPGEDAPDDPTAVVVATSGSTGDPKPALLSASALLAGAAATHDRLSGPGVWLLGVPAATVAGVMVCVRSLVARTVPVAVDLSAGFTPEAFVEAARRAETAARGRRRYAALVPTQVRRILAGGEAAVTALVGFDAVLVGGAAVPTAVGAAALDAGATLVSTYGSSETCGGCVYDGIPLDGVRVAVDAGGLITVEGAVVARGYRSRPDDPAFTTGDDGARRFRTGDLGSWDGRALTVLGRADDMLLTGGYTVSPAAVEDALRQAPEVADAVVVGLADADLGQRLVAAVVRRDDSPEDLGDPARWRADVAAKLGRWAAPEIHVVSHIPVLGPGKPDRRAVAAELAHRHSRDEPSPRSPDHAPGSGG